MPSKMISLWAPRHNEVRLLAPGAAMQFARTRCWQLSTQKSVADTIAWGLQGLLPYDTLICRGAPGLESGDAAPKIGKT